MKTNPLSRLVRVISALGVSILLLGQSAFADALDNWTAGQVVTNPTGLRGFGLGRVAYGNGRLVAVGSYSSDDNAVIESSEDGVKWTLRTLGDYSILELHDVTYANGTFVAVGWDWFTGHNIYHSTNGINWTPHPTAVGNFYGVTSGAGLFVAVGDGLLLQSSSTTNRNIYTSPNGITWTPRNSGSPANDVRDIYDVAYGAGRFVAVGSGYIYTSTGGSIWTRTTNAAAGGRISFCNGLFIAPSGPGTNLVSTDGLTWASLTNTISNTFRQVIYANQTYVALTSSTLFTSADGTNWIHRDLQVPGNVGLSGIVLGNCNFVAVGNAVTNLILPVAYVSDPIAALESTPNFPPRLKVSGLVGRSYRIDYLTNMVSKNWQTLATFSLTNSPQIWTDTQATNSSRFYRSVLLP